MARKRWLLAVGLLGMGGLVAAVVLVTWPRQAAALRSDVPRAPATAPAGDVAALVRGDLALGLDMLRATGDGDAVVSPASAAQVLRMLRAGAAGDTGAAIDRALGAPLPPARLHAAAGALDLGLAAARGVTLQGAGALWLQRGLPVERPFLDTLAAHYGAGVRLADFTTDPGAAVQDVNAWVREHTRGRITRLLDELSPDARLVLVNAVAFRGAWDEPFDPGRTRPAPFTREDGSRTEVQLMADGRGARYALHDGVQVVAMPYEGGDTEMLVLLPPPGGLGALEARLTPAWLGAAVAGMAHRQVDLAVPRLDLSARLDLTPVLLRRGMGPAFSDAADFTPITRAEPLVVSSAVQRATLRMDERETEATAATAIAMRAGAAPAPEDRVTVRADHPFLAVVRHVPTGAVLFVARMAGGR